MNLKKSPDKDSIFPDVKKIWDEFTDTFDRLYTIIFISYSTNLINKDLYVKLVNVRKLRNQIAHNINNNEPEIFVTRQEVRDAIDECIKIDKELVEIERKIVFSQYKS